jgi:benzoyl-CoA reductase subunit C
MDKCFDYYYFHRHVAALDFKKKGGQVIGYFCTNVPEEIIHAAGLLPVRIMGSSDSTDYADNHLQNNVCPHGRSCFDLALKNEYYYLDGIVFPHACDLITTMYDYYKMHINLPYYFFLEVPHVITPGAISFFRENINLLRTSLENFTGKTVSDQKIRESIKLYNENRKLLRKLYSLNKNITGNIPGKTVHKTVLTSMLIKKEKHNLLLEKFLNNPGKEIVVQTPNLTRIMLSGTVLDQIELYEIVENAGGNVVIDDLCTGARYFWIDVQESDDPMTALAERYLKNIPCPRMTPRNGRFEHLLNLARDYRVQGVISPLLNYCDDQLFDYPSIKNTLSELGIPILALEIDYSSSSFGQRQEKVETFIQVLGGGMD